jgi:hypothetical protein
VNARVILVSTLQKVGTKNVPFCYIYLYNAGARGCIKLTLFKQLAVDVYNTIKFNEVTFYHLNLSLPLCLRFVFKVYKFTKLTVKPRVDNPNIPVDPLLTSTFELSALETSQFLHVPDSKVGLFDHCFIKLDQVNTVDIATVGQRKNFLAFVTGVSEIVIGVTKERAWKFRDLSVLDESLDNESIVIRVWNAEVGFRIKIC